MVEHFTIMSENEMGHFAQDIVAGDPMPDKVDQLVYTVNQLRDCLRHPGKFKDLLTTWAEAIASGIEKNNQSRFSKIGSAV